MNQVMINAVELDMLMQENRDLKEQVAKLEELFKAANARIKLLEAEVAWVENGYNRRDA